LYAAPEILIEISYIFRLPSILFYNSFPSSL